MQKHSLHATQTKANTLTDCLLYTSRNVAKYQDDQYYRDLSRHILHTPPRLTSRQVSTC